MIGNGHSKKLVLAQVVKHIHQNQRNMQWRKELNVIGIREFTSQMKPGHADWSARLVLLTMAVNLCLVLSAFYIIYNADVSHYNY